MNLKQFQHLKTEPPEVILAALGHLLARPFREKPSRKPPRGEPREPNFGLVEKVRLLAKLL